MLDVSGNLQKKNNKFYIDINYRKNGRIHHSIPTKLPLNKKKLVEKLKNELVILFSFELNQNKIDEFYTKESIKNMLVFYTQQYIENYENNVTSELKFSKNYLISINSGSNNTNIKETKLSLKQLIELEKIEEYKERIPFVPVDLENPNMRCVNEFANMRFHDYIDVWLELIRPKNREGDIELTTFSGYQTKGNVVKLFFYNSDIKLKELNENHLKQFYDYLKEVRKVNDTTINSYHILIHKALKYAIMQKKLIINVDDYVSHPNPIDIHYTIYSYPELFKLFNEAFNTDLRLAIILGAFYGLRREEIVGLRWSNVDFIKKTITIKTTVTTAFVDGKTITYEKEKGKSKSSYRTYPLLKIVEILLKIEKKKQLYNMKKYGNGYNKDYIDFVCVNELGERIKPYYISKKFNEILFKCELTHIRFHDLRHSCAVLLLRAGKSIKDIQAWLGHGNYAITDKYYIHYDFSDKQKTATAFSDVEQKIIENFDIVDTPQDDNIISFEEFSKLQEDFISKIMAENNLLEKISIE